MDFRHVNNSNKLKNILYFGYGALSAGLCALCVFQRKMIQNKANKVVSHISDKLFRKKECSILNWLCEDDNTELKQGNNKEKGGLDLNNKKNTIVTVVYNECDKHSVIKNEIILNVLNRFDNIENVSFLTYNDAKEYFCLDNVLEKTQSPVLLVYNQEGVFGKIENIDSISDLIESLDELLK